jgi:hypothetical protein
MSGKTLLLVVAAAIVSFIGVMHSILGERYVLRRLFKLPDLPLLRKDPLYTRNVLRCACHASGVAWWGLAALLAALAFVPDGGARVTAGIVSITLLASGSLVLATAGLRHPAWALFLVAGVATWIASA